MDLRKPKTNIWLQSIIRNIHSRFDDPEKGNFLLNTYPGNLVTLLEGFWKML